MLFDYLLSTNVLILLLKEANESTGFMVTILFSKFICYNIVSAYRF